MNGQDNGSHYVIRDYTLNPEPHDYKEQFLGSLLTRGKLKTAGCFRG